MKGIYLIINKFNGDNYVGLSNDVFRRFKEHKSKLKKKTKLCEAFRKYGVSNFDFILLEWLSDNEFLEEREVFWISKIKPKYNMNKGGIGNSRPLKNSTKEKISKTLKNKWLLKTSEEKQLIIKNNLVGRGKGYKHTKKTKSLISEKLTGKKQSLLTKEKRSKKMKKSMIGNSNGNKKVVMISKDDLELKIFNSIVDASKYVNVHPSGITKVLKGIQKHCKNYKWKYYE